VQEIHANTDAGRLGHRQGLALEATGDYPR